MHSSKTKTLVVLAGCVIWLAGLGWMKPPRAEEEDDRADTLSETLPVAHCADCRERVVLCNPSVL